METKPWYALFVKARSEKHIAQVIQNKGYPTYLPLYISRHKWSDRYKDVSVPLFPGYVFSRIDLERRLPVLTTPGVITILGGPQGPTAVSEDEITAIQRLVESGLSYKPWPHMYVGARVEIIDGPLRGVEGILQKQKGEHRLILRVSLLQRSVAAEVDIHWVRPIKDMVRSESEVDSRRSAEAYGPKKNERWESTLGQV